MAESPVTPTPDEAMEWALDFDDCLNGVHGEWWKQRAWQHADEFLSGEKPSTWQEWRNIRRTEQPPADVRHA